LIGLSSTQAKNPEDKFGSVDGIVTNAQNQQPVANVQITLKGQGLDDLVLTTDATGLFADDNVLTTYTTLEASLTGYATQTHTIAIPADGEFSLDIALVPIP
jgi:hypothetical protein